MRIELHPKIEIKIFTASLRCNDNIFYQHRSIVIDVGENINLKRIN